VICGTGGQFPPSVDAAELKSLNEATRSGDRTAWETSVEAVYCAPGFSARDPQTFAGVCDAIWDHPPPRGIRWDPRVSPSPSYWGLARIPTLLIYGRHDRFGTPENAADLHQRIPRSRLVTFEDAGHFVIREAEERVAAEIGRFIDELQQDKGDTE
jgi:pimeloyl-ACP methyl ester carboxylesterase